MAEQTPTQDDTKPEKKRIGLAEAAGSVGGAFIAAEAVRTKTWDEVDKLHYSALVNGERAFEEKIPAPSYSPHQSPVYPSDSELKGMTNAQFDAAMSLRDEEFKAANEAAESARKAWNAQRTAAGEEAAKFLEGRLDLLESKNPLKRYGAIFEEGKTGRNVAIGAVIALSTLGLAGGIHMWRNRSNALKPHADRIEAERAAAQTATTQPDR